MFAGSIKRSALAGLRSVHCDMLRSSAQAGYETFDAASWIRFGLLFCHHRSTAFPLSGVSFQRKRILKSPSTKYWKVSVRDISPPVLVPADNILRGFQTLCFSVGTSFIDRRLRTRFETIGTAQNNVLIEYLRATRK